MRRARMATFAPSFANSFAVVRPMPELAPVIRATLSFNNSIISVLL